MNVKKIIKKNIKRMIRTYSRGHVNFRKFARWEFYHYRKFRYDSNGYNIEVDDKTVLFMSFKGKSYSCSPKAIYEYMLSDPIFSDYIFIWAFKHPEDHLNLLNNRNTYIINARTAEMRECLHKAKYWITNYRFDDHIIPSKDQIYVQCWHGTPLKKLGYDLKHSDNAMNTSEEIYDKYRIDAQKFKYMISPSPFATEKFTSAWNLKEFNKSDAIIETGYPRNDFLIDCPKDEIKNIKKDLGIEDVNKKIIMYAPTWRDNQYDPAKGYIYDLHLDLDKLKEELSDEYIFIFRMHYLVANSIDFSKYNGFIYDFSKYDDINYLYLASDMLITDYSSVFFDYANLKRPMLFYMYDLDEYRNDIRGFYFDIDELPGEIITNEDRLIEAIKEPPKSYDEKYEKFNKKYNPLDDGNASKRAVEIIFNQE